MATVFCFNDNADNPVIPMTNGQTSVFYEVLALSASINAVSEWEKSFSVWLACHDQNVFGNGVVDASLTDIPWSQDDFDNQKTFFLKIIDAAMQQSGWDKLGYEPNRESLFTVLSALQTMVKSFQKSDIEYPGNGNWFGSPPIEYKTCKNHSIYLHSVGCIFCNSI